MPLLARHAQAGVGERDRRLTARHTVACFRHRTPQMAHLPRQAAQEPAIKSNVRLVEHERRLAEPGDDAARDHVGTPGDRVALERDPLTDQGAGVGAADPGIGRAQMPQPAKAEQRDRPVLGWRDDLERRLGIADDDLARENEPAGINLARAGGVGGAQVLRCDEKAIRFAEGKRPADERMRARPRATNTDSLVRSAIETRDIATLAPLHAGVDPAGGNIANGGPAANPRESFKSFAGARHRSRRDRPCANRDHRGGREACAGRRQR